MSNPLSPSLGWLVVVLIAANLRPSLMGVGPLLKDIQAATGLGAAALGLLSTLPLLAFGAVSPLAAGIARRFGMERTLIVSLVLLACGIGLRSLPPVAALYAGTLLLGSAIAVGNVLVPALIRRDFGSRIGVMTSMFVTVMAAFGACGAGTAVPLAQWVGWRGSLAVWALPAVLAVALWLPRLGAAARAAAAAAPPAASPPPVRVWRSLLAWQATVFMGLQSLVFYVLVAWLPTLLQDNGVSPAAAGGYAFAFQMCCLAGSLVVPLLAGRNEDQRRFMLLTAGLTAVAYVGLLVHPTWIGWVVIGGLGSGGSLSLAISMLGLRANSAGETAALSGMAQSVGYFLAAAGPVLFGLMHDLAGGWTLPLAAMLLLIALQAVFGVLAGRPLKLG